VRQALVLATALVLAGTTAPGAGHADRCVTSRVVWRQTDPDIARTAFEVQADPHLWHTRVVAVRVDPSTFRFRLRGRVVDETPAWSVARAPVTAALALNLGIHSGVIPWGWTVVGGREVRPPGVGPLSVALAWDIDGRLHWLRPAEIGAARASGRIVEAFQSYPTLLDAGGEVPRALVVDGEGVDVEHRDGRLAIGLTPDGQLVIAITRYYALGEKGPALPIGLTLAEMAGVMRRLGCRRAVSLDGGISAQLMVRENGRQRIWRGWRAVPFGLIAERIPVVDTQ
jgi:hypothetical protein